MTRKLHKYKLLLDENFSSRKIFIRLNSRYDIKHIKNDLHFAGLKDPQVYELAVKQNRIIVTFNDRDFKRMVEKNKNSGVIGVSSYLSDDQIDKKLASFLIRKTPSEIFGKFNYISGES